MGENSGESLQEPKISLAELDEETLLAEVLNQTGGSQRLAQQQMIAAIAQSINQGENLVVQAGTGVGKSLGYLVPVSLHVLQTGTTAVIATATLALQRQILHKDAPKVVEAIRTLTGKQLKVAPLKGWSNYLCWHRLENGISLIDLQDELFAAVPASFASSNGSGSLTSPEVSATVPSAQNASTRRGVSEEKLAKLRAWARKTTTGDRDDLDFSVDDSTWRTVSVTTKECLSSACAFASHCFARQAKETANSADIVVTNHALLSIQITGRQEVLPACSVVVVDEAHQLVQNARKQATQVLTVQMVRRALRTLNRLSREQAISFETVEVALGSALSKLAEGLLRERPTELSAALVLLDEAVRKAQNYLSEQSGQTSREELQLVRSVLDDLTECLNAWDKEPEQMITWVSKLNDSDQKALFVAPLNVPGTLASGLFDEQATVLTSATLTPGGDFRAFRTQIGLELSTRKWAEIDVGTPFDFARQGLLYVAQDLPIPGRLGVAEEMFRRLLELVQASSGGMLGLFTSYETMRKAANLLRQQTDFQILEQGDDSLPALLREFAADRDSCLLGTRALWEGVDVPGNACRLVVIDRIPFVRPDDPVALALQESATKHKRSGFVEVSLIPAAVSLAQAVGRLIRASTDRGAVAILDSRLVQKNYGAYLLRSLPPMSKTSDLNSVIAALQRLAKLEF